MKLTGSQIVCEVLLDHGVDTVFGYPGGAALNIYDELYRYQDRITHVISAHEQGATHAADGYARATGKTGVVFSTSGPGATNLVTGIATAYMDSIPMVCICSNVNSELIGRDAFQEIYITGITIPITKQTYYVNHIEDLEPALRDAFKVAASGRRGPVLIDITKDVSVAMAEFTNKAPLPLDPIPEIPQDTLQEAAKLVNNSKKPLLYVGGGLIASSASAELEALIKFDNAATRAVGDGKKTADNLAAGMQEGTITAQEAAKALTDAVSAETSKAPGQNKTTGQQTGQSFNQGVSSQSGGAQAAGAGLKSSARSGASGGNLSGQGSSAGASYGAGVGSQRGSASQAGKSLKEGAKSGASGGSLHSIGAKLGEGLASGLKSALGAVKAAADKLVAEANRAAQAKAKIHSPSRLFQPVAI